MVGILGNFDSRPFDPTSVQLKWKYIYDSNNPTSVLVMLEAGGEYNGRLFMGPIGADGKFAEFPPEVSGTDIGVGYGPLELTAGADGQILSVDSDGVPVRRDGNGNIVEKLNMKTKQWEVADTRWKTPDATLTEQIKSTMPTMWFYDREAKSFVERSVDDLSFRIFERTTLYIYDKEGNEIGFVKYFTGGNLENENTEYYSLVDESTNSIIPMRLYSQMGDYIPSGSTVAPQCMFAFSDEPNQHTVPNPTSQSYYDFNHNLTSDMLQISSGEELMQVGLIRTVAMINGVSEDQIVADLKSNVPIVISFGDKQWEVNKGIDFFWSNSSTSGFDVKDGRLISYDGGQSPRSYPCGKVFVGQGIIGTAIYTYYGGEAAQISSAYLSPAITADKFMTSTVSLKRDK